MFRKKQKIALQNVELLNLWVPVQSNTPKMAL